MAGIFYLPRIFVYHSECERNSPQDKTFHGKKAATIHNEPILDWDLAIRDYINFKFRRNRKLVANKVLLSAGHDLLSLILQ